jgi:hypothetical protein
VAVLPIVEAQTVTVEDLVQELRTVLPISAALAFSVIPSRGDRVAAIPGAVRPVGFYEQRL